MKTRSIATAILVSTVLLLVGCVNEPVEWGDVAYRQSQLGDPDARSAVMSANLPAISGARAPCIQSIRIAGGAREIFRVWWSSRSDSSVVLAMQRSGDHGRSWSSPVEVESRDRGRRGCERPPPGIFFDPPPRPPGSGYVHLVYFIEASDGAGVFFAHSMDNGGMFHSPVPVVYGNAPSVASVAGNGDSVVVVFEDPNSMTPRIGIVLSHSTGHIFDQRGQVTPGDVRAIAPWVALDHRRITVWWKTPDDSEASSDRVGYRSGVWH
ncbi:MAG TPA: hypothetical protein VGJ62_01340 [Gemmatimonadaceae bacterium]|jgi:hypothetical protein